MFKEIFINALLESDSKQVKELLKCKSIKSATIGQDGNFDIITKGDVKSWETDGTGDCLSKLKFVLIHAYEGLAGRSFEVGPESNVRG